MVWLPGLALATLLVLLPQVATAQRGQQIFDLFLQGAQQELYRQQQLEHQRHQRQEMNRLYQQYVGQWQACHADHIDACDQALTYPFISDNDRQRLLFKRSQIIAAQQEAAERARRERQQRDREEQSERDRERELVRQREDADRQRQAAEAQLAALRAAHARQPPSQVTTATLLDWSWLLVIPAVGIAVPLSLAFVFRDALRERVRWALETLQKFNLPETNFSARAAASPPPRAESSSPVAAAEAAEPAPAHNGLPPPLPDKPRDTPGAIAALELAYAFIEEIRAAETPAHDDTGARKHHLNTLALASRQLNAAQQLDPDALLEGQDEREVPYRFTVNELKSEALLLEGITHQVYDLRRAIPALVGATKVNPNNARAFYVLGLVHAANMNKASAVAAFRRAVALEPKNITYRKELSRAESLTAAEIAGYKATRAGERVFDAGITAWNVFAITWNIVTFPIRIVFSIFRLLRLAPFA